MIGTKDIFLSMCEWYTHFSHILLHIFFVLRSLVGKGNGSCLIKNYLKHLKSAKPLERLQIICDLKIATSWLLIVTFQESFIWSKQNTSSMMSSSSVVFESISSRRQTSTQYDRRLFKMQSGRLEIGCSFNFAHVANEFLGIKNAIGLLCVCRHKALLSRQFFNETLSVDQDHDLNLPSKPSLSLITFKTFSNDNFFFDNGH